ncbi:putative RNA methyltransferase [Cytobacillus sp. FJAT-53684]|uniref:RNA methyltransferase n=1 Tax=Cytobacillus mangrovibacter TaxID=3299024 RepID=A0ABW6K2T0_9BACI
MTKKTKRAAYVNEFASIFRCPICKGSMKVVDFKSLICVKNHTFDFAKQGYLNLMNHPSNTHYNKELFEARHHMITSSHLYTLMHEEISKVIKRYMSASNASCLIVDAGCGEGSHLQQILNGCMSQTIAGVGLDISKEGIIKAAKKYEQPIWLVGDLAKLPFQDQSIHVILNILSPSNYKEFKRVLVPEGIVIKVVPGPNYLKELREVLFSNNEKKAYRNEATVSLFKKNFQLLDVIDLCYTKKLAKTDLRNLVQMTPLAWSSDKENKDVYLKSDTADITVDLAILVGINK